MVLLGRHVVKNYVILAVVAPAIVGTVCGEEPAKGLLVDLGGGVAMEFVLIPAGKFLMGDEAGLDWEKPVHEVVITKPFYLGKYEVTQEQWEAVMGDHSSRFRGPKNPVETVSWRDCQAFVKKLNARAEGGASFSLPTEAQWEYACRAGTTTGWSFGDDAESLDDYAWHGGNSGPTGNPLRQQEANPVVEKKTHPVGGKKPNAWGLYDMHGNVWEWCADWWGTDYYGKSPAEDPTGPQSGASRVLRGGSWLSNPPEYFKCAHRWNAPGDYYANDRYGFRVARTLAP